MLGKELFGRGFGGGIYKYTVVADAANGVGECGRSGSMCSLYCSGCHEAVCIE